MGNIRLTYEFVKESFEKEECILLSKVYINNHTKLDYICSNGHKHSIKWNDWQQGIRCLICAGKTRLTIKQIRKTFEKDGYILLSENYVNAKTKLEYICPKGHSHSTCWNKWHNGNRCPTCSGKAKPTMEQIIESFNKDRYILLSEDYINNYSKLDYICPKGHNHNIGWNSWQQGHRCPTCANINNSITKIGNGNPSWKGGMSCEPYCPIWSDKEYKEDIKLRDKYKCLNPYCSKKSSKLHIHHIDYNKKNCHPSNLITICNSCNSMANKDRNWHQTWYQAIIKNRYGGTS
jgi:hypothetical protein